MLTDLHELLMLHQLDRQEQPGKLDQKEQQLSQNQVQKASEFMLGTKLKKGTNLNDV